VTSPDPRSPAPRDIPMPVPIVLARCLDCMKLANPAYGSREGVFCRDCAPEELRHPTEANSPGALSC
jgi:hypothetical protein